MEGFNTFLANYRIGDYAGILGLFISIGGFILTVRAARASRDAALQAKLEVENIGDDLRRINTVSDISATLAVMEEIKRLHRESSLQVLLERYASVTKSLIFIRAENSWLSSSDLKLVQGAITQFAGFERLVEDMLHKGDGKVDAPQMNTLVVKQMETIQGLLVKVRARIGGGES